VFRVTILFVVALFYVNVVLAQSWIGSRSHSTQEEETPVARPAARPAETVPFYLDLQSFLLPEEDEMVLGRPTDILSEAQILRRISRIYAYQSRLIAAQADEDEELAEDLLELAMTDLSTLVQQPDILNRPRFRELYRTIISEYERYYEVSADTLTLQFGDIFQFRADMFLALNEIDEPLLEDVNLPEIKPFETTIPMTMNRLVEESITYLTRSPEKHLHHWLGRAETYFPMIEKILEEESVPDELKYLAMIESGLNPRARSWARANGMWQFISATGASYGLQVNRWVDERLDPEKATRAAARHLRDLHEMFGGDWQLAMAGYNCSPARIKRAIRNAEARTGRKATFWDIYRDIPRETRNYVPMFIAAALVASNPEAFDVDLEKVTPGPEYAYHYVPVQGMIALEDIATLAGTDLATLRALNPELRRQFVPPAEGPYYVRIPLGTYDQFATGYAQLPKEARRSVIEYTVRKGDSLGKIGERYGLSVSALMRANNLKSTTIRIGQYLIVPVSSYESGVPLASMTEEQALTVHYGDRKIQPIEAVRPPQIIPIKPPVTTASLRVVNVSAPPESETQTGERAAPTPSETENAPTRITYKVRRGDTLSEIAERYDVSTNQLRRWNNINGSRIRIGQQLVLFGNDDESSSENQPESIIYRIRSGDTLGEIAEVYGIRTNDLRRWNNIRGSRIRVGQRLTIYPRNANTATTSSNENKASSPQSSSITYSVRRGDSLYVIARKYGVSIEDLKRWNQLTSDKIKPGQKLTIHT